MELIIYNPKEDGFIQSIDWNFEELKAEITEKAADYSNLVYSDDQIMDAKKDRADLNKFRKALDDKRKDIKKQVMNPYKEFESKIKELICIVDDAVLNIDGQIKGYEDILRQEKEVRCREIYAENIGDMDRIITFEKVFDPRWLNKTTTEKSIREDIISLRDKVDSDLKAINADTTPYVFEMKEEYLKDFNLTAAIEVRQKLEILERKKAIFEAEKKEKEAENKRKLEEEARAVHDAGITPVIRIDADGNPVVVEEEKQERVIEVTFRVKARESQFGALNEAIRMLRMNSETVEMLERKEV